MFDKNFRQFIGVCILAIFAGVLGLFLGKVTIREAEERYVFLAVIGNDTALSSRGVPLEFGRDSVIRKGDCLSDSLLYTGSTKDSLLLSSGNWRGSTPIYLGVVYFIEDAKFKLMDVSDSSITVRFTRGKTMWGPAKTTTERRR